LSQLLAERSAEIDRVKKQARWDKSRIPQHLEGYMEIDPQEAALRAYKKNARASVLRWFS
jgi:hypothetical protein